MVTSFLAFLISLTMAAQWVMSAAGQERPSLRHTISSRPSFCSSSGTSYRVSAVVFWITQSSEMLQNRAIFFRMSSGIGTSLRHTSTSGWMPRLSSSFTECWVGLLFSSPLPGIWTIRGTWM